MLILRRVYCGWFACLLFITPAKLASVAFLSADFKLPLSEECAVNHQLKTIAHRHFSSRSLLSSVVSFWLSARKQIKRNHTWYLSFFLHEQNFWRIKFTPKKRVNYDKIAIFLRYYGKIQSKLPIFCVKSIKIYTGQKNFTWIHLWRSWQISGMNKTHFVHFSPEPLITYTHTHTSREKRNIA